MSYPTRIPRLAILFLILALLISPWLYIGNYAGDSQVHLIYGENAANGGFFEFNSGEKSPGVTSPGYMLYIAMLFKILPAQLVPLSIKATNMIAWYGLLLIIYLSSHILMRSKVWAGIVTAISGVLPGSVYNSNIGMENGIFAFGVFLWFYLALRINWFTKPWDQRWYGDLALGTLMGLLCWIRPEGLIIGLLALTCKLFALGYNQQLFTRLTKQTTLFIIPYIILIGLLIHFYFSQTGYLIPTSGISRVLISNISPDSFQIGPVYISIRLATRLLAYFPLTFLWIYSFILICRGSISINHAKGPFIFLIVVFISAFVLYSTFIGSIHTARYIIFALPALIIIAMTGARWIWENPVLSKNQHAFLLIRTLMIGSALILITVFVYETNLRMSLDSKYSLLRTMKAPLERPTTSESLYEVLGRPPETPLSIGLQEVQLRYWLDDRFIIRSLDGRVDPTLLEFANRDSVNHIEYLKERRVNYLFDTPSYNRSNNVWSLRDLQHLKPNDQHTRSGVTLTNIPIDHKTKNLDQDPFESSSGSEFVFWFIKVLYEVNYIR